MKRRKLFSTRYAVRMDPWDRMVNRYRYGAPLGIRLRGGVDTAQGVGEEAGMTLKQVNDCVKEAHRFLDKARAVEARVDENDTAFMGCKETGALRRASLDLTRALADLRRR